MRPRNGYRHAAVGRTLILLVVEQPCVVRGGAHLSVIDVRFTVLWEFGLAS